MKNIEDGKFDYDKVACRFRDWIISSSFDIGYAKTAGPVSKALSPTPSIARKAAFN